MCFFSQQSKTAVELEHRFNAGFKQPYAPASYNGFAFPATPVITNKDSEVIQLYTWGLLPVWAIDKTIQRHTLNARMETLHEKPAFRSVVHNRCLVLADAFFEWEWLDEKGKQKQKYKLTLPGDEAFGFAGLWSVWTDKRTGKSEHSYTILTTEANELMSRIHNSKKRMPVIIHRDNEAQWLQGGEMLMQNDELVGVEIS